MAKNKKKRKNRNKKNQLLKKASAAELFQQSEDLLNAGKPRDAIATLKTAAKKGWPRDQIDRALFKAYSLRAVHLREKGMESEAEEVNKHACALMPSYQSLTDEELLPFLRAVDTQKAAFIYAEFLESNKPSGKIEQHLAGALLVCQKWDLMDMFDDGIPLTREISSVMDAVNAMNAGAWESALESLNRVPRTSPWAALRVFCRAMVCFYKEDDTGMQRALNMIPDDALLKTLSRNLANDIHACTCLWDGPVHLEDDISNLLDEIQQHRFRKAEKCIKKIAKTLSPRETDRATFHILELLCERVTTGRVNEFDFLNMMRKLLPRPLAELLAVKIDCFVAFSMPFSSAAEYLSMLDIEFPGKKDRAMATAFVILKTIENFQRSSSCGLPLDDNGYRLKTLLNLTSENLSMFVFELLLYAIQQDPENRAAYELLLNLPAFNRQSKKWIEEGLSVMRTQFPDDPFPCLELAKLYYSRNAYRKAENILNEAMTRAPHDIRVVNMHVMSLLISSDKNITRGKPHLAGKDIAKAESLVSPETRFLVTEKQILLRIAEHGQLSLFKNTTITDYGDVRRIIEEFTQHLTPFECLRALGALYIDINDSAKKKIWDKKMIRVVYQAIRRRLKSIDELTRPEINSLLMPLTLDLPVIPGNDMAGLFVQMGKGVLGRIDDAYIIRVFDSLISTCHFKAVLKEIKRRKKTADKNFAVMLDFYEVTIKHLTGDLFNDESAFFNVIDNVSASDIEPLRATARRLAPYAEDNIVLKKALENFDFKYLASSPFMDDPDDFYDDEFDDEFDDELYDDSFDDEMFAEMNKKIITGLEKMIVEGGLKGASKKELLKFKDSITRGPIPFDMTMVTASMDKETLSMMSRELRVIIFGKA
ncbi:MAG: tetratricopeptide repeat protein [Dissulfuribacterales bacterium]